MQGGVRKPIVRIELEGGRSNDFSSLDRIRIGRSTEADFTIPDETISREHLIILLKEDGIWLMDNGSSNGTFIKGQRLEPKALIPHDPSIPIVLGSQGATVRISAKAVPREPSLSLVPSQLSPPKERAEPSMAAQPSTHGSAVLAGIPKAHFIREQKLNDQIELLEADLQARKAAIAEVQTLWQAALMDLNQARAERDKAITETVAKAEELEGLERDYQERKVALQEKIDSRAQKAESILEEAKLKFELQLSELEQAFVQKKESRELEASEFFKNLDQTLIEARKKAERETLALQESLKTLTENFEEERSRLSTTLLKHQEDEKAAAQETRSIYKALEKAKQTEEEHRREHELRERKLRAVEETEAAERGMRLAQINREIEEAITRLSRAENDRVRNEEAALSARKRCDEAVSAEETARLTKDAHEKESLALRSDIERLSKRLDDLTQEKSSLEAATLNAHTLKDRIEAELDSTRQTILEERARAQQQLKMEEEEARLRIQSEAEEKLGQADLRVLNLEKQASIKAEQILKASESSADSILEAAQSKASAIESHATSEAKRIVTEAAESVRQKLASNEAEIKQSLEKHASELASMRSQLEREKQELRKKAELEITQAKAQALTEARSQGESELRELQSKRKSEVRVISRSLLKSAASLLKKGGMSATETARILEAWSDLETIVEGILTPSSSPESAEELKRLGLVDPSSRLRAQKYWIRVGIGASLVLLVTLLFTVFRENVNRVTAGAVEQMKERSEQSDAYIKQMQSDRIAKSKYQPYQDTSFRDSYTENVLFLKGFAEMAEDQEYQNKWVLEMNRWFQREFEMSEKVIVNFAPVETNLLKELIKLRSYINPQFEKEGIDRMREAEASAVADLKRLLGSPERYRKFRVFQEHFFQKHVLDSKSK